MGNNIKQKLKLSFMVFVIINKSDSMPPENVYPELALNPKFKVSKQRHNCQAIAVMDHLHS